MNTKRIVLFFTVLALALIPVLMNATEIDELTAKANKGDAEAQYELAMMYLYSDDVQQNVPLALKLLNQAANQNNADALAELGELYYDGELVDEDMNKAESYFRRAAENGSSLGMASLGTMYISGIIGDEPDFSEAYFWYSLATWYDDSSLYLYMAGLLNSILEEDEVKAVLDRVMDYILK